MEIVRPLPRVAVPQSSFWADLGQTLAKARCRLIHRKISLPVNGKYICWSCLREFRVKW